MPAITTTPGRRIEQQYLPRDLDELARLRRELEALGDISSAELNGIIGWLVATADGQHDVARMSRVTRARYRRALRRLEPAAGDRAAS